MEAGEGQEVDATIRMSAEQKQLKQTEELPKRPVVVQTKIDHHQQS